MAAGDGHVFPASGGAAMDDCKIPLGTVCVLFPRRPQLPWPTQASSSVILEGDCHQRARSQLCQVVSNQLNILVTPPGVQVRASVDIL